MPQTFQTPLSYLNYQNSWYVIAGTWYQNVLTSQTDVYSPYGLEKRTTESDPNWKAKIAAGLDASTAYYIRRVEITPVVISVVAYARSGGFELLDGNTSNLIPDITLAMDYEDSTVADIALKKLKRKLNDRTQSFNSLVPLAEIRDLRTTVKGLASLTTNVVGALRDVKKGRFKGAWSKVSDIWLTYSFGARPLMKDISDIGNSITAYINRHDSIDRLSGSHTKSWRGSSRSLGITGCLTSNIEKVNEEHHTISYKYICGHKFLLESANDYSSADHFGFSPPKLIPAIWELIAFSWVIDYFTTVGDFLDDTFSGQTGESIYIIKNKRYVVKGRSYCYHQKNPGWDENTYLSERSGYSKVDSFEFSRTPLAAIPARVLRFRTLDEIGLNGVTKLLNLTSVAAGFSGRR